MTKSLLKSPLQALELIADLGLHSSIFTCPRLPEEQEPVREPAFIRAARTLEAVRVRWEGELAPTGMEHAWLAAALVPFEGFVVVGKKELPAVSVCVAEGLKVSALFDSVAFYHRLVGPVFSYSGLELTSSG